MSDLGWPRRDVADHHEELCERCGVELGAGEVIRSAGGAGRHPICHEPPARPRRSEVLAFWDSCLTMAELGAAGELWDRYLNLRDEVVGYLDRRGLLRACRDLLRVLPFDRGARSPWDGEMCPPWARYGSRSWAETGHRLIVPVYDHAGRLALVRGWRWSDDDSPKRLAAAGCSVKGLVMAGGWGLQMLRGVLPDWIDPQVVIVEGEPDWLAATIRWPSWAVLGIVSGCWCEELAWRVPGGAQVLLRTDADEAGERYATQIAESLKGRCRVERWRP